MGTIAFAAYDPIFWAHHTMIDRLWRLWHQKHPNARVFAFGIGSSVNRFLLDNIAKYGRGEVEYVGLQDDGSAAARRFHERVRNPLLTDISIDWNGMPLADVYPKTKIKAQD